MASTSVASTLVDTAVVRHTDTLNTALLDIPHMVADPQDALVQACRSLASNPYHARLIAVPEAKQDREFRGVYLNGPRLEEGVEDVLVGGVHALVQIPNALLQQVPQAGLLHTLHQGLYVTQLRLKVHTLPALDDDPCWARTASIHAAFVRQQHGPCWKLGCTSAVSTE